MNELNKKVQMVGQHSADVEIEIPFHDVDGMWIVWHGHYYKYFEIVRAALFRKIDYKVDPLTCPRCSSAMRAIAFIENLLSSLERTYAFSIPIPKYIFYDDYPVNPKTFGKRLQKAQEKL